MVLPRFGCPTPPGYVEASDDLAREGHHLRRLFVGALGEKVAVEGGHRPRRASDSAVGPS